MKKALCTFFLSVLMLSGHAFSASLDFDNFKSSDGMRAFIKAGMLGFKDGSGRVAIEPKFKILGSDGQYMTESMQLRRPDFLFHSGNVAVPGGPGGRWVLMNKFGRFGEKSSDWIWFSLDRGGWVFEDTASIPGVVTWTTTKTLSASNLDVLSEDSSVTFKSETVDAAAKGLVRFGSGVHKIVGFPLFLYIGYGFASLIGLWFFGYIVPGWDPSVHAARAEKIAAKEAAIRAQNAKIRAEAERREVIRRRRHLPPPRD